MSDGGADDRDGGRSPPDGVRVDVVQYADGAVKAVPAGKGAPIAASQHRSRPLSVLRDRWVLAAGAMGVAAAGGLSTLVAVYSVLVLQQVLVGALLMVLLWGVAGGLVAAVGAARWVQLGDAGLLDEDVPLRDAREQWAASPVSALSEPAVGDAAGETVEHAREHAAEGAVESDW